MSDHHYKAKGYIKAFLLHMPPAIHKRLRRCAFLNNTSMQKAALAMLDTGLRVYEVGELWPRTKKR